MASGGSSAADAVLEAGTPVLDGPCAPATSTPATFPFDAQKLLQLVAAVAKNLGFISAETSASDTSNVEPHVDSAERRPESTRRPSPNGSPNSAQLSDDAGTAGHDSDVKGRTVVPNKLELVEVLRSMVVGGETTPRRSNSGWSIASVNTDLAVLVVEAVEALYRELGVPKGKSLACTAGPVDREEGYGYLITDVMGRLLISATGARSAGEKVRKRNSQHAVALPEAKKQAKKQAKRDALKAGSASPEVAASKAAEALERELLAAELDLQLPPPSPPPLLPQRPRKRVREPAPERSEFDVPTREEQMAAFSAAHQQAMQAFGSLSRALQAQISAATASERAYKQHSTLCDRYSAEDWGGRAESHRMSQQEWREHDLQEAQCERAEQKAEMKQAEEDAANEAAAAAETASLEANAIRDRMAEWMRYPDVVTPFPWAGKEYIVPCSLDDLDYYETCHRGYPAGVREWKERWYAHHRSIGLPLD